jgi:NADPH:quinone reductase-like Zn-dependent oxidoreductase
LAKSLGAYVATTVAADDRAYVKELRADEVIDYKEAFEEKLTDFDAVFDIVGGDTIQKSFRVLKKGSVLVSMLGQPDAALAQRHGVTAIGQLTHVNTDVLKRVVQLVDNGTIKARIAKVFSLEQATQAFQLAEEGPSARQSPVRSQTGIVPGMGMTKEPSR